MSDTESGYAAAEGAPVCLMCGRVAASAEELATARLTWTRGVEDDRTVWTCQTCSREHLRSIEGKLDSSWW